MRSIDYWLYLRSVRSMEDATNHIQLACFILEDKQFAVDIMRIREIIVPHQLSPFPCSTELLEGVINLRGTVIPVMNMRKRFGIPVIDDAAAGKVLIVTLVGQLLALIVDDVMEVISVPVTDIKSPILIDFGVGMEIILGVCLVNTRVVMILDIDSLLCTHT